MASGLQDYVEVLDAPLVKQQIDGKEHIWYQVPDMVKEIEQIDMLTVDGPPQTSDSTVLARYPALPAFAGLAVISPGIISSTKYVNLSTL